MHNYGPEFSARSQNRQEVPGIMEKAATRGDRQVNQPVARYLLTSWQGLMASAWRKNLRTDLRPTTFKWK